MARRELVGAARKRYRFLSSRVEKSRLIDETVRLTGYHRKHVITLLNQHPPRRTVVAKKRSGRPRAYRHCLPAIETAWEALDYCCAERLHPVLLPTCEALARHAEIDLPAEVRSELEGISRATLARRLRDLPRRKPRPLFKNRHPNRVLLASVPVDRYAWNEDRPGALEVDLVEHSGGVTGGHHAYTLSIVDIVSGWSHRQAVMGKSQAVVLAALELLLTDWPSSVWALHSDNGREFLSAHLIAYCQEREIDYHRSRPYRKNDNAHVEQKNRQLVREIVGYERIDTPTGLAWLNSVYNVLDVYANLILPGLKVISKKREGSKIRKRYDTARTPFARLQALNALLPERRDQLQELQASLNPLELRRTLDRLQRQEPQEEKLAHAAD